jgi:hypothetical protein
MPSYVEDEELHKMIIEAQERARNSGEAFVDPYPDRLWGEWPFKDSPRNLFNDYLGLPGIIEFRITDGSSLPLGKAFVELLKFINIPALTGVDDDTLSSSYWKVEMFNLILPNVDLKIFGLTLDELFPVWGTEKLNKAGIPTTWPRLILYLVIVLAIAILLLVVGWKSLVLY